MPQEKTEIFLTTGLDTRSVYPCYGDVIAIKKLVNKMTSRTRHQDDLTAHIKMMYMTNRKSALTLKDIKFKNKKKVIKDADIVDKLLKGEPVDSFIYLNIELVFLSDRELRLMETRGPILVPVDNLGYTEKAELYGEKDNYNYLTLTDAINNVSMLCADYESFVFGIMQLAEVEVDDRVFYLVIDTVRLSSIVALPQLMSMPKLPQIEGSDSGECDETERTLESEELKLYVENVIARDWKNRPELPWGISRLVAEQLVKLPHSAPGTIAILGPSTAGKTTLIINSIKKLRSEMISSGSTKKNLSHAYVYVSVGEPDVPFVRLFTELGYKTANQIGEPIIIYAPVFGPALIEMIKARLSTINNGPIAYKSATLIVDSATLTLFTKQAQFPFKYMGAAQKEGVSWPMRELLNMVHLLSLDNAFPIELIMVFNTPGETVNMPLLIGGNVDHLLQLSGLSRGTITAGSLTRHLEYKTSGNFVSNLEELRVLEDAPSLPKSKEMVKFNI